jgi:hypothetical protein
MTDATAFNNNINAFNIALNAYAEATKNNIIALQDKYIETITSRNLVDDLSTITGVKITGATNLPNSLTTNVNVTSASCQETCKNNSSCVGALYTNSTQNSCQLYSSIPPNSVYSYDASSSFISYNHYMPSHFKDAKGSLATVNARIMNALEERLTTLLQDMARQISGSGFSTAAWDTAIINLNTAKTKHLEFENAKKINEDANSQLQNSGLDVIRTKTKYILFIAALLILLAIYVRDFNFSITVFIILFIMISVYGSIFLGAFLLVLIVLYLVYYAY